MSNKQKRAQITFFVLLAVLVLVMFVFFGFIKGKVTKKVAEAEAKIASKLPENVRAVETFVTSCLDEVAKDGLEKLGKQGGKIFNSQGGPDESILVTTDEGKTHIKKSEQITLTIKDYFVEYLIAYSTNQNEPVNKIPKPSKEGLSSPTDIVNTMEYQLEVYTRNKFIGKCAADATNSLLKEFETKGLEIKNTTAPEVDVVIGTNNVLFNLNYSLNITDKKTDDRHKLVKFSTTENVRLAKIYQFISDVYFNPILSEWKKPNVQTPEILKVIKGMDGKKSADGKISINDEIFEERGDNNNGRERDAYGFRVIIEDTESKIRGENYQFWFMRQPLELTWIVNKLGSEITKNPFNPAFDLPNYIETVCIADSAGIPKFFEKGKFELIYKKIDAVKNPRPPERAGEVNIFFITNPQKVGYPQIGDSKNRLVWATKLSDKLKIAPVPFVCYNSQNNKITIKGGFKNSKVYFTPSQMSINPKSFGGTLELNDKDRDGDIINDYFYDGLKLDVPQNNHVTKIELDYEYDRTPQPVKFNIETDYPGVVVWQGLKFYVPQDDCKSIMKFSAIHIIAQNCFDPTSNSIKIELLGEEDDCKKGKIKIKGIGIKSKKKSDHNKEIKHKTKDKILQPTCNAKGSGRVDAVFSTQDILQGETTDPDFDRDISKVEVESCDGYEIDFPPIDYTGTCVPGSSGLSEYVINKI